MKKCNKLIKKYSLIIEIKQKICYNVRYLILGRQINDRHTSVVLKDAFLLYMLPVIGAIIFYTAGSALFNSVIWSTVLTVAFLAIWFASMRYYSKNKVVMSSALEVVHEKN